MKETIINVYPIMQFIIIMFAIVGGYNLLNNIAHILGRFGKDKLDNKKDIHAKDCDADVMQDLIQKYPLVQKDFMILSEKEMNIENNQEIQEINSRLDRIDFWLSRLNIQQSATFDEVKGKKQ